jgi:hypothetical protein
MPLSRFLKWISSKKPEQTQSQKEPAMLSSTRYRKGDTIGGRFFVHQALQGGMGEVYLCLDLKESYPCALKTFQQKYHFDLHPLSGD